MCLRKTHLSFPFFFLTTKCKNCHLYVILLLIPSQGLRSMCVRNKLLMPIFLTALRLLVQVVFKNGLNVNHRDILEIF